MAAGYGQYGNTIRIKKKPKRMIEGSLDSNSYQLSDA